MAASSSVVLSPLSTASVLDKREHLGSSLGLQKSSFFQDPKLIFLSPGKPKTNFGKRYCYSYRATAAKSLDHIPKQFREENLKDGCRKCHRGEHFFSNYLNNGGMWSMSGMDEKGPSKYSMSVSMYRGGARGYGRPRTAPPDLPSLLLDSQIVYLGMPIVPAVTELLVAQFMWLDYDNPSKPIYLYINSSGTQYCKSDVYTVNCGMAYGQAAMLLALGTKGYHAVQPNCFTKLYLPKVSRSSGAVIDMWIKAKELDVNTECYIELLAKGIEKSKEEIEKDIQRPKYFQAQEAIDYGIADKIIDSRDVAFDKRNYEEMLAQSKAMRKAAGAGPQAAPSGFG